MIAPFESENAPVPGANGSPALAPDPPSVEGLLFAAGAISADQLGEVVRDAVLSDRPVAAVALERGFVTREGLAELLQTSGAQTSLAEALGEAEPAPSTVSVPFAEDSARAVVSAATPIPVPQVVFAMPAEVPLPAMSAEVPLPAMAAVQQAVAAAANGAAPVEAAPVVTAAPVLEVVPVPAEIAPSPEAPLELSPPTAPELQPGVSAAGSFAVSVRLESGERVAVETADSFDRAAGLARGIVESASSTGEWPFVSGRFIRPTAIVSIDIERTLED